MRATQLLHILGGEDCFLNKFMLPTPLALGLAAYAAFTTSLLRWLRSRDRGELLVAAGATLAAGLMHPVIVLDLVPVTIGFAVLAIARPATFQLTRRSIVAWTAALLAGAVPAALYTARIMGGAGSSHRHVPFDLSPFKLLGLFSTLALGLLLAARPAMRFAHDGGEKRAWVLWLALQLGGAMLIRLPGPPYYTVDKFAFLAWIPRAITAGPALAERLRRFGLATGMAILLAIFLPVNGLAIAGRIGDPLAAARQPWDLPGYVWMRAHLPADAVLLLPYGDPDTGAFTGRDQYFVDEILASQFGYSTQEVAARRAIVDSFFASDSLTPAQFAHLRTLGRPVYAVWTDFADPRLAVTPRRSGGRSPTRTCRRARTSGAGGTASPSTTPRTRSSSSCPRGPPGTDQADADRRADAARSSTAASRSNVGPGACSRAT